MKQSPQNLQDRLLALTQLNEALQQQVREQAARLEALERASGDAASGQQFTSAFENAAIGMAVLGYVSRWYAGALQAARGRKAADTSLPLPRNRVILALVVLAFLTFTKNIYMASIASYYTFYVIDKFAVGVQDAQLLLFVFLGASAVGVRLMVRFLRDRASAAKRQ